jgi:hypothetical protein
MAEPRKYTKIAKVYENPLIQKGLSHPFIPVILINKKDF